MLLGTFQNVRVVLVGRFEIIGVFSLQHDGGLFAKVSAIAARLREVLSMV